jgi:hypothetical protein
MLAKSQNIAFLVALAFAVAASGEPADDPLLAVLEGLHDPWAPCGRSTAV